MIDFFVLYQQDVAALDSITNFFFTFACAFAPITHFKDYHEVIGLLGVEVTFDLVFISDALEVIVGIFNDMLCRYIPLVEAILGISVL